MHTQDIQHADAGWANPEAVPLATSDSLNRLSNCPFLFKSMLRLILNIRRGQLILTLPGGEAYRFEGSEPGPSGIFQVNDYALASRVIRGGNTGLGEAYMDKLWDSPDLAKVLQVIGANVDFFRELIRAQPFVRFMSRILHGFRGNSKTQAKKNIEAHYDLGNAFYETWLDPSMTYSAALFTRPGETLEEAQRNKYRHLAEQIDLGPDEHCLEIGCGWGGFAEYAAGEVGAKLTGITISREQFDYAGARMARKGLSDRADIQYRDYRDVTGKFDRIASIEMFEAVGEAYWPRYFQAIKELLKEGGKAGLQVITIREEDYPIYRKSVDFIQRYIFPGGMLPSPSVFKAHAERAGLKVTDTFSFAVGYADTLKAWNQRFLTAWPKIEKMGFDERFKRMWVYYLAYCEAGFRMGNIDVVQVRLEHA